MNPDVVAAIARLRTDNVLSLQQAALFSRVARRQLVSVRLEIRALLYLGVLLLTSGVGALLVEHHRQIGPVAIAGAIGLAAIGCLAWVARRTPAFSWAEVPAPGVAFEYVLLLGLLLFASDLAYVEAQFTVLGPRWPQHLLVVGVVYLVAAYRWDSSTVLALALTTLAAWRGVSVSVTRASLGAGDPVQLRVDAIALGMVYVALAVASVRLDRKPHFEQVFASAGLVLMLGGLVSGVVDADSAWGWWLAALLLVAALVTWAAFARGRSLYFALAVLATYAGLMRPVFAPFSRIDSIGIPLFVAALLALGALALIVIAHRRMVER
jgi:hypothetical protein